MSVSNFSLLMWKACNLAGRREKIREQPYQFPSFCLPSGHECAAAWMVIPSVQNELLQRGGWQRCAGWVAPCSCGRSAAGRGASSACGVLGALLCGQLGAGQRECNEETGGNSCEVL